MKDTNLHPANKNQILYVEDDRMIWEGALIMLREAFPNYKVIIATSESRVEEQIDIGVISLEHVAIVCTDGSLAEFSTGWDVMERLRSLSYTGPALYIGATPLPADKEHLYSGTCNKLDGIVESILEYLVEK